MGYDTAVGEKGKCLIALLRSRALLGWFSMAEGRSFKYFFASNLFPESMLFEQLCFYSLGCTFLMALSTQDVLSQANELGWDLPNGQLNV